MIYLCLLWVNRVKYERCIENLEDIDLRFGDVILYRSRHASIFHDLFSPFTHAGMMINESHILEMNSNDFDLYEDFGERNTGVNVYDFGLRWKYYSGEMYVLRMTRKVDIKKRDEFLRLIKSKKDMKFHKNIHMEVLKCATQHKISKRGDIDTKFCSEFIAYCLNKADIMNVEYRCKFPSDLRKLEDKDGKVFSDILIKLK